MNSQWSHLLNLICLALVSVLLTACARYYQFEHTTSVGKFEHHRIPDAIYVHKDDDFVIGTDIRLIKNAAYVAGNRALAKFSMDYDLQEIFTLNKKNME